ncbi:GGDEF domain-containing protein [Domibacillus indicus]|uniref:GGDEF domain-containing protein n=1 Tax=Domibacillus indicus TaxID=1437523 RepID=UPI00203AD070|nr:GGDEF domain-containing protein [Domibacillus indicus]MCM3791468.1 GGDEF domain-containing protein [Domibacillus indicus]
MFKKINDHYGHLCGDEALKHLVTIVKKNIRATDMFARIGGEEFILTLTDTSLEDGMIIIERIRKQVASSSFIYKGQAIPITISLGLTEYKRESIEQVLEKADKALYQAKETGRNKWVIG